MPIRFLSRLMASEPDPREALRPLWHRVVALARNRRWYADCGVDDSVEGRFDMVTSVLAVVMIRMEQGGDTQSATARLTELFVEDMDGQLRESGVGDVVVGKHMGRLMSTLGGRIGAYRDALSQDDDEALADAVRRNVSLGDGGDPACVAEGLRALHRDLAARDAAAVLAGEI